MVVAMALHAVMATTSGAAEGNTTLVSVDASGNQANGYSDSPSISADGHYVAFRSRASNLVPNDTNERTDIFVRDRQTDTTELVNDDGSGNRANYWGGLPSISADGRFVAFHSGASNLVPNDTNGINNPLYRYDNFVHDRRTGTTQRVSVDSFGNQVHGYSRYATPPSISSDGRFVAFSSNARKLVANDTNERRDVFVHERDTTAPRVTHVVPAEGATGVALKADVVATFSERMDKTTLNKTTFKLYELVENPDGTNTTEQVTNVTVTPSLDGLSVTLDPYGTSETLLAANTRYKAVVSTGASDAFGNRLDQNPSVAGSQSKVWYFETGS